MICNIGINAGILLLSFAISAVILGLINFVNAVDREIILTLIDKPERDDDNGTTIYREREKVKL